jgi:phage terminase large subunit-like protein
VEAFAREYLKVTRGKGARAPFRLRPWQKQIVSQLLLGTAVRPRQALLSLPRGSGKTSLAAVLGAYGLYADGVESAEVVVVASDVRQAGITLRQIARMGVGATAGGADAGVSVAAVCSAHRLDVGGASCRAGCLTRVEPELGDRG